MFTRMRERRGERMLARAHSAALDGDYERALAVLTSVANDTDSVDVDQELVALRHRAFLRTTHRPTPAAWPPPVRPVLDCDDSTLAEVSMDGLDVRTLRDGILGHGSLVVRGLLSTESAGRLRNAVESSLLACDRHRSGVVEPGDEAWYTPFEPAEGHGFPPIERTWVRDGGGVLAADSPRGLRALLEELERAGVVDLITQHLGERPALSVLKTTLRRVPPNVNSESGWHQDGAFLGESIRTVNVWIALSACGVTAPSLDVVPGRLASIVPTGTPGAAFDWSVSGKLVAELCPSAGPVRAVFAPGDAILFDEMNLHRTAGSAAMVESRYAIEAWFFAPSVYPMAQIPLQV